MKKVARSGLVMTSVTSGALSIRERLWRYPRVWVLTYHDFGDRRKDPFCVRVSEFERQMAWLVERDLAVSLEDVLAFRAGLRLLRHGSVLVTIDDGWTSLRTQAMPVLQRLCIPAVAFVSAGQVSAAPAGNRTAPHRISRDDIRALADAGITIGSHGWSHRVLRRLSLDDLRVEVERSRETLERWSGRSVTAFAYPFGTRATFDEQTADVIRKVGYVCAFTSQHGAVTLGADPWALPRVKIEGGEGLWMFRYAIRGALDGWALVDRVLWPIQTTG